MRPQYICGCKFGESENLRMSTPSDNTGIQTFICDIPDVLPDVLKEALADNKADNRVRVGRLISLLSPNYFISDYLGLERYLIRGN